MTYQFRCPGCDAVECHAFSMDDVDARAALRCGTCGGSLRQDYAAKTVLVPRTWGHATHYDTLPDDVKGSGPHSKASRDYAARTWPARNGRWL